MTIKNVENNLLQGCLLFGWYPGGHLHYQRPMGLVIEQQRTGNDIKRFPVFGPCTFIVQQEAFAMGLGGFGRSCSISEII